MPGRPSDDLVEMQAELARLQSANAGLREALVQVRELVRDSHGHRYRPRSHECIETICNSALAATDGQRAVASTEGMHFDAASGTVTVDLAAHLQTDLGQQQLDQVAELRRQQAAAVEQPMFTRNPAPDASLPMCPTGQFGTVKITYSPHRIETTAGGTANGVSLEDK